jgi:uncharacterized protein involved in response to NO
LTAFTNALTVSLLALVPGQKIAWTAIALGVVGLGFVLASLLSLFRLHLLLSRRVRDAVFLIGLMVVFVLQVIKGLEVRAQPNDEDPVRTIAILVVMCFLVGISRAWELIGGPEFDVTREVTALFRKSEKPST